MPISCEMMTMKKIGKLRKLYVYGVIGLRHYGYKLYNYECVSVWPKLVADIITIMYMYLTFKKSRYFPRIFHEQMIKFLLIIQYATQIYMLAI